MKNYTRALVVLSMLSLVLGGCRKELYYGQDSDNPTVDIKMTWPSGITTPDGVRAIFYPIAGGTPLVYNISSTEEKVIVPEGTYNVVLFNNDTEYVKLYNTSEESTLEAKTTTVAKSGTLKSFPTEDVVNMPDMFYSCKAENFTVSRTSSNILEASPKVRVKTFKVRVNVTGSGGMTSVSSATGFISDVYGSFFPGSETYPTTSSAIYFDFDDKESDHMVGTVRTFGINNSGGNKQSFKLLISLTDGNTVSYECDITDLLNVDLTKDDVVITIPITINIAANTSSGFNVTVSDWNNSNTDIPI